MQKIKAPSRVELRELIESVGGEGSFFLLLEKFYQKMSEDILIGFFFTGKDLKHIARQQGHFVMQAAGLISEYQGKGPSTAHVAMPPILSGHFDRRVVLLREVLNQAKIAPIMIERWLQFEESFRAIVVRN